jgi:hypothetical protein
VLGVLGVLGGAVAGRAVVGLANDACLAGFELDPRSVPNPGVSLMNSL